MANPQHPREATDAGAEESNVVGVNKGSEVRVTEPTSVVRYFA